ncbi:hypothetical protein Droror1_Dr00009356 [Drosera rotundifolia]
MAAMIMVTMMLLLLFQQFNVNQIVALRHNHPHHDVVDAINRSGGPYIGLVMAYPGEEVVLQASGLFVPNSDIPLVLLSGRRYNVGTISGVDVIYVMTGEKTVNAGVAVQILLDAFDIIGVVHYGIAGSTNDSLLIGDVAVLNYVAFTNSWDWEGLGSDSREELPQLSFGDFDLPQKGNNSLANVEFVPVQLFSIGKLMEQLFWLPIDSSWFNISTQLQELELQQCQNETYCLTNKPKVAFGLRGATADVFLNNEAYRNFLFKEFNISTADEESAAVVMTALSNNVPSIVFRGVSDMAGAEEESSKQSTTLIWSSLAAVNALRVAVAFIELIGKGNPRIEPL